MGKTSFDHLPSNWPLHFNVAIKQLNRWILPAYKFSLNELCLGTVVNTAETLVSVSCEELVEAEVKIQNQYAAQQNLDAYSHIMDHANQCKAAFDHKVVASRDGVIEFKKGDLVQVQDSKLDFTVATEAKLLPCWGTPHCIVGQVCNSYCLETIQGLPIVGLVSACHLQ